MVFFKGDISFLMCGRNGWIIFDYRNVLSVAVVFRELHFI